MGYTTVYPSSDDPMTQELFTGTILAISVVPALLMLGSLVAMKFYSLDGEKMEEVQMGIARKKFDRNAEKEADSLAAANQEL